jgi:hypothetical protein
MGDERTSIEAQPDVHLGEIGPGILKTCQR